MAQEPGGKDKSSGFFKQNQTNIILGLVILVALAYFAITRINDRDDEVTDNQPQEQVQDGQNQGNQNTGNGQQGGNQGQPGQVSGNVTASGTLRNSDDASRGNYLLDSPSGKVYVQTSRDFSSLVGKEVSLQAEGTLNKFAFLGFTDRAVVSDDAGDVGGAPDESGNVNFTGTLRQSDNLSRGNYVIVSGATKVYLQSVRDYSAWVDSTVNLTATGTLDSFANALLSR